MMKKSIQPKLCLLLCLVLSIGLLAGCGEKKEENKPASNANTEGQGGQSGNEEQESDEGTEGGALTELPMPLTEEKVTLKVLTYYINSYIEDPNDLPGVQAMEEATNVHIDWVTFFGNEIQEKWGLLLSSGDLPDLMYPTENVSYPGGVEKAIEDGMFMDCTDLVENYMPNYREMRLATGELEKDTMTDSGTLACIYGFNSTDTEIIAQPQWTGLCIRRDMLDSFGYTDTPETIDDWHELLTVAKQNGVEAPLLTGANGYNRAASFMSAYGILPGMYQENGVVKYAAAEPGYKEWVQLFRDWYKEGLLDPNFVSNDAYLVADNAYAANGKSVAFQTLVPFTEDGLYTSGIAQDENIHIQPVLSPVLNEGDTPHSFNVCSPTCGNEFYISASTKHPEIAAMWLDYQYTEEGMRYNFYGIEGESYELVDGEIKLLDSVINNPDYSISDALSLYARGNGIGRYNWNVSSHYSDPKFENNMNFWQDNQDFSLNMPVRISMTEAEGTEYNTTFTSIETLTNEMTVKFIMGTESMDGYEKFVEDLYTYGLQRCIDIQQAALDRYNNRGN
ncbi:MAG: extracellular solute-binding protein [Lachnospiraceae bacterium]|jgi:putative aldouronate transport system substrate-binding protein|nr:extracellular solute-binding protein [Lachnospiraceae bacterium]